jgi:hypothetical protein
MNLRTVILTYLGTQSWGTYKVSQELPWDNNGRPLYWTNLKTIYVDTPNVHQIALTDTFNSQGFVEQTTLVRVYFVNDAKLLPTNFDMVAQQVLLARTATGTETYTRRLVQAVNSYVGSHILSTFEFSFQNILTN